MNTRTFPKTTFILLFLCYSQQLLAGGSLLQVDTADDSIYHSVKWSTQQFPITWHLSQDGYPGSGISNEQLTQEFDLAFNTWSAISSGVITFNSGGEVNENSVGIDGINLLTFTDQDYLFPQGEAAFAVTFTFTVETTITDSFNDIDGDGNRDLPNGIYPAGTIYEADIVFNGSKGFEISGLDGSPDLQALAIHEIGHVLGLSHSVIDGSVMYPFQSADVNSGRLLKQDDIAHIAHIYSFSAGFSSSISGRVINGYTGEPVLGAHVFVAKPSDNTKLVGAYSLKDGKYFIPGVRKGYVGIEPLNGRPIAKDPARINELIKNTFDIDFIPEFYDANESNVETSPLNAQLIDLEVAPGVLFAAVDINITTNTSSPPGVGMVFHAGLNLFAYPVETMDGFSAFDLLQAFGKETEINSIDHYNPVTGRYERVFWQNGIVTGINFPIQRGEAYLVHLQSGINITFEGVQNCPLVNTKAGFNLIGIPCPPPGYSAFDLLTTLGGSAVSVRQYKPDTATFETAIANVGSAASGDDFPIVNGVGYMVEMLVGQGEIALSGGNQNFPAFIEGISPGRAVAGARVVITGMGFSEEVTANEVLFNGVRSAVTSASVNTLTVIVPNAATTGLVTVGRGGAISNGINFIVEPKVLTEAEVANKDIVDGQSIQGVLSTNEEQDRYNFIASQAAYVTATAVAPAGAPELVLFLEGPSGELLAGPEITRVKLPRTGRYTVVVAALPGTGAGAYTFTLKIEQTPAIKDITVISGSAQTGIMGTRLPVPMEVYISGAEGQAMSGMPVTLTTSDSVSITSTSSTTAATYQLLTNESGIAMISVDLPMVAGVFDINIQIPGYPVKTIRVSAIPTLPVLVEISGDDQTCGGTGCVVGQAVTNPYKLRFLDSEGNPVKGVVVDFEIVSGDGSIEEAGVHKKYKAVSYTDGIVNVKHILGFKTTDGEGNFIPQIVAATTTYTGAELILFQSTAKADVATTMLASKTANVQMTMGTAELAAVILQPIDKYSNPVANLDVSVEASGAGGLLVAPGFLNGVQTTQMKTNEQGVFVGMLVAGFDAASHIVRINEKYNCGDNCPSPGSAIRLGSAGVAPTIDEFGARIKDPYKLRLTIGDAKQNIMVDVDMGPRLIMSTVDALYPGAGAWVGKDFDLPINAYVTTFQRTDECEALLPPSDVDDDGGDWRNENFSINRMRRVNIVNVPHTMKAIRLDEKDDAILLDSPRDDYLGPLSGVPAAEFEITNQIMIDDPVITITTLMASKVKAGNVQGDFTVLVTTDNSGVIDPVLGHITHFWAPDTVCLEAGLAHAIEWSGTTYAAITSIEAPDISKLKLHIPLKSVSPKIEYTVTDFTLVEPVPDPLVSLRSISGIDLQSLEFTLNSNVLFNGTAVSVLLGKYPNYIEMYSDNAIINELTEQMLESLAPQEFRMIYYPKASELNMGAPNIVTINPVKDKVENKTSETETVPFILP